MSKCWFCWHFWDFRSAALCDNSTNDNVVFERNIANCLGIKVGSAVAAVQNRMHDLILTAMNSVVMPIVGMAVKLITGSSRHGPNSIVQNPDQKDFLSGMDDIPLLTIYSRTDLNINDNENNETWNSEWQYRDWHFSGSKIKSWPANEYSLEEIFFLKSI